MKLIHAADIHLDSPLRGLDRIGPDNADLVRQATRRALENLVKLTLREEAQVLIIAGDLYDGDWNDFSTGQFFLKQMATLADSGVEVVMVTGNHDAASQITRSLRLPTHVKMLSTDAPESHFLDDLGVVVHGQSYANRSVQANLAAGYPRPTRGLVNVGVLHTSAAGYDGHQTYAPCSKADLEGLGYHYMALGHVHNRQAVVEGDHPAWFSGNTQGRHARETGPKGALVVDLEVDEPAEVAFRVLDHVRWELLDIDATGLNSTDDVLDRVDDEIRSTVAEADGRPVIGRFRIHGSTPVASKFQDDVWAHAELKTLADKHHLIIEKLRFEVTAPPSPDPEADEVRAAVGRFAKELEQDVEALREIANGLDREIRELARGETGGLVTGVDFHDAETLQQMLRRALGGLDAQLAGDA